ncbi:MAG: hypothetical protein O2946_13345, partial [Planctomycetota bacterium]|nr:hypothetical protein [Planctomycetota bacterium]
MPAPACCRALAVPLIVCNLLLGTTDGLAAAEQTGTPHRVIAGDDSTRTLAALSPAGEVEWKLPVGPIHDLHLLPGGHMLYQDSWTHIVEVDADRKVVWEYDAKTNGNENRPVEVHAFQRLPGGLTMIVESGPARIIEVD